MMTPRTTRGSVRRSSRAEIDEIWGAFIADISTACSLFHGLSHAHIFLSAVGPYEKRESYQHSVRDRSRGASKTDGHLSPCFESVFEMCESDSRSPGRARNKP